jgi:hypothetical protein
MLLVTGLRSGVILRMRINEHDPVANSACAFFDQALSQSRPYGGSGKRAFAQGNQDQRMLVTFGYELTFNCPQPTMIACLLDAHRERSQELHYEIPPTTIPAIPTTTYLDTFGNTVRRFMAPSGDLTITSDAVIEDSGLPDPIELDAGESPVEQLPNETLVFLLGSRYCETDRRPRIH